jgi:hypothetical protein
MSDWERPSVFVQYKGTDICLDFHCICDTEDEPAGVGHYDGYDAYALRCGRCGRIYEMPTEIPLTLVTVTQYDPVLVEPDATQEGD